MKIRAVILAGGEGTRLGVLTAKRTKPAVPFAGIYRIIDFTLSNCVKSELFDVTIIAQYRPRSLIEHIGAGGPWDLNREYTGGVRIYTPFRSSYSGWFVGTADAVQQNFTFIKSGKPDLVLILSGDHIYNLDYREMIRFHLEHKADMTMATIPVTIEEASRFGIVGLGENQRVTAFVEKPAQPPSTLANMGVYLFNMNILDELLWKDHNDENSSHDFGKNIIPTMIKNGADVYAYPFYGYWVDVGTVQTYWQAHMDLLRPDPPFNLYDREHVIYTRSEERPPALFHRGAEVIESMVSHGCIIHPGAKVRNSILSPGVVVHAGAVVEESIVLTDAVIKDRAIVQRSVLDKGVMVEEGARVGDLSDEKIQIAMVGKKAVVPPNYVIRPGGMIGTEVVASDYSATVVKGGEYITTRRGPNEI